MKHIEVDSNTYNDVLSIRDLDERMVRVLIGDDREAARADIVVRASEAFLSNDEHCAGINRQDTHISVATDARITQIAPRIVDVRLGTRWHDGRLWDRDGHGSGHGRRRGIRLRIRAPDGVNDDAAWCRKLDELMRAIVGVPSAAADAQLAQVKVGAVEALVADADDDVVAAVAPDVVVDHGRRGLVRHRTSCE